MVRATATQAEAYSATLTERDKFLVAALDSNLEAVAKSVREDSVRTQLAQHGLGPYLGEPGSRIQQEIAAISHNLDVTPEEAARYLQSYIRQEPAGVNGGQG
jgi:hypothetical protein